MNVSNEEVLAALEAGSELNIELLFDFSKGTSRYTAERMRDVGFVEDADGMEQTVHYTMFRGLLMLDGKGKYFNIKILPEHESVAEAIFKVHKELLESIT